MKSKLILLFDIVESPIIKMVITGLSALKAGGGMSCPVSFLKTYGWIIMP